jgi:pimeloyl-ACP methyl ester carboxylesterase
MYDSQNPRARRRVAGTLVFCLGVPITSAVLHAQAPDTEKLDVLLDSYFRAVGDAHASEETLRQLTEACKGDAAVVAARLPHLRLWSEVPEPGGEFRAEDDRGMGIEVAYRPPAAYSCERPVPVVLCVGEMEPSPAGLLPIHGDMPGPGYNAIVRAAELLGERAGDMLLVGPNRSRRGSLWQPPGTTDGTRAVLRETRRRFHVDERRVYLFGSGEGSAAAWMTALAYPDLFAAVITDGTGPDLPYPSVTARLLAPNLASSTVLVTVGPVIHEDRCEVPDELFLDTISQAGRAIGLRLTTFPRTGPDGQPIEAMSGAALSGRRVPLPRHVSHWFRYPEQGRAYWLRAGKLRPPVWEAEALSIRAAPGTDRDEFIARVLRSRLGWIEGRVEGNTIRVRTSRVGEVDVFFPPGLVDLSQPVTVECNGRRRFRGMVEPDLRTMLELARSEWTFTEVPVATRRFSLKSDEIPDPEWGPR